MKNSDRVKILHGSYRRRLAYVNYVKGEMISVDLSKTNNPFTWYLMDVKMDIDNVELIN